MPQLRGVSLDTDQAGLFGVLQVVPVALGDLAIHSLLHPRDRIDQPIAPLLHEFDSEGILGIDGPDEEHSVLLPFGYRDLLNVLIGE